MVIVVAHYKAKAVKVRLKAQLEFSYEISSYILPYSFRITLICLECDNTYMPRLYDD